MDPMENLCTICGAIFSSVLGRIKHEKASHSLIELKCKECKYVALGKKNLNNHIQIHKESRCDFCWKTFKASALVKHKAICISNPEVIIVRCDQCPVETKRKDNAMKMGSPSRTLGLRSSSPSSSPRSSPSRTGRNNRKILAAKYLNVQKSF